MNIAPLHFADFFSLAGLVLLAGIYRKLSIMTYQHKLMWADFAQRKGISPKANGASTALE